MARRSDRLDEIVSLSKRRGIVFPSSEIYGGLRASWDYGPLGVEMKNNIKRQWWRSMVQERDDIVGLDSSVILAPEVWQASGHLTEFVDPLTECLSCHRRFRADQLIEAYEEKHGHPPEHGLAEVACPHCGTKGAFTEPRMFNGLLRTYLGADRGRFRPGLPAPGDGTGHLHQLPQRAADLAQEDPVRDRADRQVVPQRDHAGQLHLPHPRVRADGDGVLRQAGNRRAVARAVDRDPDGLAHRPRPQPGQPAAVRASRRRSCSHYSKRTVDIEYRFGFPGSEWGELEGIANRTDFDLSTHGRASGQDMSYLDAESGERYVPYVIEPAAGVDRCLLAFLLDAYTQDEAPDAKGNMEKRTVLRLDHRIAPVKVAVLPLSRNADLSPKARDVAASVRKHWNADFDDASAIGRRYRRQDEIGTPYCVTVDFETLNDQAVTVRERDSMKQERIGIDGLISYLSERMADC